MSREVVSPLILASASPRRRELLQQAGIPYEVIPSEVCEQALAGEKPEALVERLALAKATAVARRLGVSPRRWVLGADTVVVVDGEVLGKPKNPEHALELLRRLVGRTHRVLTGIALTATDHSDTQVRHVVSEVVMHPAQEAELSAYVAGGEPLDKAGAYAAQGEGRRFIQCIVGSETNVIGLPLEETLDLLQRTRAREEWV